MVVVDCGRSGGGAELWVLIVVMVATGAKERKKG